MIKIAGINVLESFLPWVAVCDLLGFYIEDGDVMTNNQKHMDHMLLPKATLMRFKKDSNPKISVLNLYSENKCEIKEYFPRSFHTKNNYYIPSVDKEIKKYETMLGKLHEKLSEAVKCNNFSTVDFDDLKRKAIRIITLQFHRFVLIDLALSKKFFSEKTSEYNNISSDYFKRGIKPPPDFLLYLNNYRVASKNPSHYFQKHFLMNKNSAIEEAYSGFNAIVLSIPEDVNASFLLPPQHFIGIDTTARIILSPKLAIGLYPPNDSNKNHHILTKDEVDSLIPRSIEAALFVSDNSFKQLVGEELYLRELQDKINEYREMIQPISEPSFCKIKTKDSIKLDSGLEAVIILKLIHPDVSRVILEVPDELKNDYETLRAVNNMFEKYGVKIDNSIY